ncbi:hypothetical protein ABZT08_26395 [Streptomyces sp. NPDC005526]|uniref:hypothetical protein n=1 Tax=Streptomyces sp. NPDC005526 TaxID=3156885 RepID=UPI0033AB2DD1
MKSLKAAAVVAGSLVVAGAAAPAFAQGSADLAPTSLSGGVNTLAKGPIDVMPLKHQSDALDTENKGSVLSAVKGTTTDLNRQSLLGGLPLKG